MTLEQLKDAWEHRLAALRCPFGKDYKRHMRVWTCVVSRIPGSKKLQWFRNDQGELDCLVNGVIYLEWHQ